MKPSEAIVSDSRREIVDGDYQFKSCGTIITASITTGISAMTARARLMRRRLTVPFLNDDRDIRSRFGKSAWYGGSFSGAASDSRCGRASSTFPILKGYRAAAPPGGESASRTSETIVSARFRRSAQLSVPQVIVHPMYEWETSVVVVLNSTNQVLLVRQDYGYRFFGLPGGRSKTVNRPTRQQSGSCSRTRACAPTPSLPIASTTSCTPGAAASTGHTHSAATGPSAYSTCRCQIRFPRWAGMH